MLQRRIPYFGKVLAVLCALLLTTSNVRTCPDSSCIIAVAESQIGNCEEGGNNRGYHVEKYLRAVNLGGGYAWCSAFVAWTLDICGVDHNINAWSPTAVAQNIVWEKGKGEAPKEGDVFGIYYRSKGRIGHVGFIEKWGKKYATTIEGNTNEEGSREGDCVLRKYRHKSVIYRVSRWD
jgi:hypothetical protein